MGFFGLECLLFSPELVNSNGKKIPNFRKSNIEMKPRNGCTQRTPMPANGETDKRIIVFSPQELFANPYILINLQAQQNPPRFFPKQDSPTNST